MRLKVSLILLALLSGCGNFQEKFSRLSNDRTTLQIQTSGGASGDGDSIGPFAKELWGRSYIAIVGQNGLNYSRGLVVPDKTQLMSLSLPNGQYKLYAVGWDGDFGGPCANPNNCYPVEGQAYCSDPNGIVLNLSGGSISITINLAAASCNFTSPTIFTGGQAATTTIKPTSVRVCASSDTLPSCTAPGASHDVQMELLEYEKAGDEIKINETNSLSHGCAPSVNNTGSNTSKNPPIGFPFISRFRLYPSGSSCNSVPSKTYLFRSGLVNYGSSPGTSGVYYDYSNASSSHTLLLLKE